MLNNFRISKVQVDFQLDKSDPSCYNRTRARLFKLFKQLGYISDVTYTVQVKQAILCVSIFCDSEQDMHNKIKNTKELIDATYLRCKDEVADGIARANHYVI